MTPTTIGSVTPTVNSRRLGAGGIPAKGDSAKISQNRSVRLPLTGRTPAIGLSLRFTSVNDPDTHSPGRRCRDSL